MIPEYALNAEDVREMMLNTMERHLTVKTDGYRCTTDQTFNLLLKAVAEGSSLEAVCADSCGTADSNTLREQMNAALNACQLRQQEVEMNAALASAIPAGMPRGGLEVAIDTHDEPFYGKTLELLTYTCSGQAQGGTTHFFRIARAYVIWREVRLTLALTYVLPEDNLPGVVERLLQRLGQVGFTRPCCIWIRVFVRVTSSAICSVAGRRRCWRPICSVASRAGFAPCVRDGAATPPTIPSPTGQRHAWRWSIPGCVTRKPSVNSANGWRLCWSA